MKLMYKVVVSPVYTCAHLTRVKIFIAHYYACNPLLIYIRIWVTIRVN